MSAVADFSVQNHGTIVMVAPNTTAARDWVDENLSNLQGWQWLGASFAVDRRLASDIVSGILADGLTVDE